MDAIFSPRICLIDPNPVTRALLREVLHDKGFDVAEAADMASTPPSADAVIIAMDGTPQHAKKPHWLTEKPSLPVIVLDRPPLFPGLAAPLGFVPDARLALPIEPRKLVATLKRLLSLARVESAESVQAPARTYRFCGWTLHCDARRLQSQDGASVQLNAREFEVLKALLSFPRQVVTRQQLIAMISGPGKDVENRALDGPITRLRRHLGEDVRFPRLIKTIVGMGYRLEADVEKSL